MCAEDNEVVIEVEDNGVWKNSRELLLTPLSWMVGGPLFAGHKKRPSILLQINGLFLCLAGRVSITHKLRYPCSPLSVDCL